MGSATGYAGCCSGGSSIAVLGGVAADSRRIRRQLVRFRAGCSGSSISI
ncbi:uncharacterized protein FFE2_16033 [Fusarium fujikuroi]|nr:uncharacterized protein FFE2_16033 [Fusarium fujikuroi]